MGHSNCAYHPYRHDGIAAVASLTFCLVAPAGWAADTDRPRFELLSGVDVTANSNFSYSGIGWAPGGDIDMPGFRIRVLGGYGVYAYDGSLAVSGIFFPVRFSGNVAIGELLAGHLWRRGEWTLKAYAGTRYEEHAISPADPSNSVQGARWGPKGQVEIWRNLGTRSWFSADGSYASAFDDYWVQARLGHRANRWLTVGAEAGALGNEEYDAGRGGVFLRVQRKTTDITLSGGVTGDYFGNEASAYISFGLYHKR